MLFSTPFFLFCFFPLFLLLYWKIPARRGILLLSGLLFYGWAEPIFVWVVVASALFDWRLGQKIATSEGRLQKTLVGTGVAANIALLVYAKYAVFAATNLNLILESIGVGKLPVPEIALPLGISFIVFEKITYLVDLKRHSVVPAKSLIDYLNYVFLFPKLLAGPIVKYHDVAGQLSQPGHSFEDIREGLIRFIVGLGKKVLIADALAPVTDQIFHLPASALDPQTAWLGLICFTLQIFFDFSGYSDMAIGMGRMLGFRLLENFRDPYLATSFTDFWRRWHISLSSWIKEYLYIPLGGSRVSTARSYANLCLCFLLSGLWHGASWNFVTWGAIHGIALVADRAFWLKASQKLPVWFNRMLTLFLVALSWVFFRCETFGLAMQYLAALFGTPASTHHDVFLSNHILTALLAGVIVVFKPLVTRSLPAGSIQWRGPALAGCVLLLFVCSGRMAVNTFRPFLYFRF